MDNKQLITYYAGLKNKPPYITILLNDLVVNETEQILNECGKPYNVISGKIDRRKQKLGFCYYNTFKKSLYDNYQYVEGIAVNKITGEKLCHAWNVDNEGNHIDFTFKNANDYNYYGVIIPIDIVSKIGLINNGVTYSTLAFITKDDL